MVLVVEILVDKHCTNLFTFLLGGSIPLFKYFAMCFCTFLLMGSWFVPSFALFVINSAEVNFLAQCVLVYMCKNFSMVYAPMNEIPGL